MRSPDLGGASPILDRLVLGALEDDNVALAHEPRVVPRAVIGGREAYANAILQVPARGRVSAIGNIEHRVTANGVISVAKSDLHLCRPAELADIALFAQSADFRKKDAMALGYGLSATERDESSFTAYSDRTIRHSLGSFESKLRTLAVRAHGMSLAVGTNNSCSGENDSCTADHCGNGKKTLHFLDSLIYAPLDERLLVGTTMFHSCSVVR